MYFFQCCSAAREDEVPVHRLEDGSGGVCVGPETILEVHGL